MGDVASSGRKERCQGRLVGAVAAAGAEIWVICSGEGRGCKRRIQHPASSDAIEQFPPPSEPSKHSKLPARRPRSALQREPRAAWGRRWLLVGSGSASARACCCCCWCGGGKNAVARRRDRRPRPRRCMAQRGRVTAVLRSAPSQCCGCWLKARQRRAVAVLQWPPLPVPSWRCFPALAFPNTRCCPSSLPAASYSGRVRMYCTVPSGTALLPQQQHQHHHHQ